MTRILVTGGGGFVAPYIVSALIQSGISAEDILLGRRAGDRQSNSVGSIQLDVTDERAVNAAIAEFAPSHVVHLAGVSSLPSASADPDLAWKVNVHGSLNVARALIRHSPKALLIFASSGQIYGETAKQGRALTEEDVLQPISDYAVTKAAADLALGALSHQGLRCVRFRLFNHAGAGQAENFVLPSFAGQIARIEAGLQPPVIMVGNLSVERDFLDVRDVADAYVAVIGKGSLLPTGIALNISSGAPQSIQNLLERLVGKSSVNIRVEKDARRYRSNEVKRFFGDSSKARQNLDWRPTRSIDHMLDDILAEARNKFRNSDLSP